MTINLKNFLNNKSKLSKMGEFQNLKKIDGLEMSSVSADLYGNGRDDLTLFYFRKGANYASVNTSSSITSESINWNNNSKNIIGKINGLYPVPGAFFIYKGERYKILKAEPGNGIGKTGEVISDYLEIACGDKQSIKIKEIQRQGKKPQNIGEFMLGSQIKKGIII